MTPLLSRQQMQAMDSLAINDLGLPSVLLMEVAGRAVVREVKERLNGDQRPVLVLAGPGNNGADAVVAARHLRAYGDAVELLVLCPEGVGSDELLTQIKWAQKLGLNPEYVDPQTAAARVLELAGSAPLIIDGLFGTGLVRQVEGHYAEVIAVVNELSVPVVAVDIASGIDADTGGVCGVAMRAVSTVTFQWAQPGHLMHPGRTHCGDVRVVDIGIPPIMLSESEVKAFAINDSIVQEVLPPRDQDTHKGTYGHLLVVAGTPDRPGSALLGGRAALRSGVGLVTLASTAPTIARIAPALDELMGLSAGSDELDADVLLSALPGRTSVVIGPSLEPNAHLQDVLRRLLAEARLPVVIDAGALVALGQDYPSLCERPAPTVLTPHPGEMARMLGVDAAAVQADRLTVARRVAADAQSVVVLKGASTVIAEPSGRVAIVTRGNPGMATGGTGDVLAGVVGALLAQGVDPWYAACAGAQIHSRAGDQAYEERGASLVASDLINALNLN